MVDRGGHCGVLARYIDYGKEMAVWGNFGETGEVVMARSGSVRRVVKAMIENPCKFS